MIGHWVDRKDLWKCKARSLHLQIRSRFRVAVDRHCRRPKRFDGYFSTTVHRCLNRFRHFGKDSLSSTSVFYRKRVPKDIYAEEDSVIVRKFQALAVPIIGSVSYVFMHGFNRVQVYGSEKLHQALLRRPENTPLLTVSNHVASLDDPLVIASLLPRSVIFDVPNLRWALCAADRCFNNPVTSAFFQCVKVLPLSRGDGIYQKGMDLAISKLNSGGWVHVFPEGTRSRDGGRSLGSAKRGVGRLVLDADHTPLVLPFVHSGMQDVMPIGATIPRIGKTVTILVGDPIDLDDLVSLEQSDQVSRGKLYDAVSSRIGRRLHDLKAQVEKLVAQQSIHGSEAQTAVLPEEANGSSFCAPGPEQRPLRLVSRVHGYVEQNELVGFAARALFVNRRGARERGCGVGPLKAWKRFLEANLQQWRAHV